MKKTKMLIFIFTITGALQHTGIHPGYEAANAMHKETVKQLKKKKTLKAAKKKK